MQKIDSFKARPNVINNTFEGNVNFLKNKTNIYCLQANLLAQSQLLRIRIVKFSHTGDNKTNATF